MGSLRNPIGPLPSSIYWRRRAVALVVLALLVLVVSWVLFSGDGDNSSRDEGKGGKGNGPASTITPGPTDSGPVNSQRPGGRDEENGGSEGSGGSGSSSGAGDDDQSSSGGTGWGTGPGSGAAGGGSDAGASGGSGGSDSSGGSGGGKAALPASPSLANCAESDVKLKLRSVETEYGPGEKPKFELKVVNKRGGHCKIDLGRTATIVTITNPDDAKFWASDDCPPNKKAMLRQVPAHGESVHTLTWFRKASAANCGTPTFDSPKPGTYEIEVKVKGLKKVHTTFKLVK
ncbi:hypothetical protein [Streptomyces axinellae]|uniref:Uncharacterized protein n=1 Tax=Streptomyces axinellae TaxID=552788 RepID=A0ABP6C7Y7_9ACTN